MTKRKSLIHRFIFKLFINHFWLTVYGDSNRSELIGKKIPNEQFDF